MNAFSAFCETSARPLYQLASCLFPTDRAIAGYMKIKPAFVFDHVRLAYHVGTGKGLERFTFSFFVSS